MLYPLKHWRIPSSFTVVQNTVVRQNTVLRRLWNKWARRSRLPDQNPRVRCSSSWSRLSVRWWRCHGRDSGHQPCQPKHCSQNAVVDYSVFFGVTDGHCVASGGAIATPLDLLLQLSTSYTWIGSGRRLRAHLFHKWRSTVFWRTTVFWTTVNDEGMLQYQLLKHFKSFLNVSFLMFSFSVSVDDTARGDTTREDSSVKYKSLILWVGCGG